MSLIATLLSLDAAGRINSLATADVPTPFFNGGTPTGALGSLVVAVGATPTVFVGGLGYNTSGALCTQVAGTPAVWNAGIPVDASGRVCSAANVPASWVGGIPLDAAGRVCINAPSPPFNLKAFSNAFAPAEFT